jgi:hypothetical protein
VALINARFKTEINGWRLVYLTLFGGNQYNAICCLRVP